MCSTFRKLREAATDCELLSLRLGAENAVAGDVEIVLHRERGHKS